MGSAINDEHPVFEWLIEHAGWPITHLRIGADGKTAWERVTGRPCAQPLVEFGEVVWAKPLRRSEEVPGTGRRPTLKQGGSKAFGLAPATDPMSTWLSVKVTGRQSR